jgi:hypothetical protein
LMERAKAWFVGRTKKLPVVDAITNQTVRRSVDFSQKFGRRRVFELDWTPRPSDNKGRPRPAMDEWRKLSTRDLANRLQSWREQRRLSLRKAAMSLGISHAAVWQFEHCKKRLPKRIWEMIRQK